MGARHLWDVMRYRASVAPRSDTEKKKNVDFPPILEAAIAESAKIDVYAWSLLMVIAYRCNDKARDGGVCFGSQGSLGRLAAMSAKKAGNCLRDLRRKFNLISYNPKPTVQKDGGILYNTYKLNWEKMMPVIEAAIDVRTDVWGRIKNETSQETQGVPNREGGVPNREGEVSLIGRGGVPNRDTQHEEVNNVKETNNNNNEEDVVVYEKFLAQEFGVNTINREAVRERVVGKDPKKFVEVVRSAQEALKEAQKKNPDKGGDYGVGIALNKMLNVPKAPSAANPTLEELQQLAFAQPEKVEKLEGMDLNVLEKRVPTIMREKFGIDKESPCYGECAQKYGACFGNLDGRARRIALLKFIPRLEAAWEALTQAHPKPTHEESTETLRKVFEEYETGNR